MFPEPSARELRDLRSAVASPSAEQQARHDALFPQLGLGWQVIAQRATQRLASGRRPPTHPDLDILERLWLGHPPGRPGATAIGDVVAGGSLIPDLFAATLRGRLSPLLPETWLRPDTPTMLGLMLGAVQVDVVDGWGWHLGDAARTGARRDAREVTDVVALHDAMSADWRLASASRRWDDFSVFQEPMVTGDAIALRFMYAHAAFDAATAQAIPPVGDPATVDPDDHETWTFYGTASELLREPWACLSQTTPYWVGAELSDAVFSSEPPTDEVVADLRLPFAHTFVGFGAPIDFGPALDEVPDGVADAAWEIFTDACAHARSVRDGSFSALFEPTLRASLDHVVLAAGVLIEALVLHSDGAGRLADDCIWCVAIPSLDSPHVLARLAIPARLSAAAPEMRAIAHNVAGVVAVGEWSDPPAPIDTTDATAVRRAVNRGKERSGVAGGIRVLTVRRTSSAGAATGDGARVRPHERRGHLRRVRVGSRQDWQAHQSRRAVWIPPTWVNADLGRPARDTVRRAPDPDATADGGEPGDQVNMER